MATSKFATPNVSCDRPDEARHLIEDRLPGLVVRVRLACHNRLRDDLSASRPHPTRGQARSRAFEHVCAGERRGSLPNHPDQLVAPGPATAFVRQPGSSAIPQPARCAARLLDEAAMT